MASKRDEVELQESQLMSIIEHLRDRVWISITTTLPANDLHGRYYKCDVVNTQLDKLNWTNWAKMTTCAPLLTTHSKTIEHYLTRAVNG